MAEARRLLGVVVAMVALFALTLAVRVGDGFANDKAKGPSASAKAGPPPGESINACGCYHDAKGGCVCTDKKGKCECPGECEPVGCDEKRDKEMQREMAAEIKRAQEDEKRRKQEQEAQENGTTPDASAPPAEAAASKTKASRKTAKKSDNKADKKSDQKSDQKSDEN